MARVDAHVVQPHEYDELPELTDEMLVRGKVNKVSAIATEDYLRARATRADPEAFKAIPAKTPNREPLPDDEL